MENWMKFKPWIILIFDLVTKLKLFNFRIYISSLLHFKLHWRLTMLCFINVDVIMANNQWHSPNHRVYVTFSLYEFLCNRIFYLYSVHKWTSHKKVTTVGKNLWTDSLQNLTLSHYVRLIVKNLLFFLKLKCLNIWS